MLQGLERTGKLLSGEFHPRGLQREWCEPEVLRRLRRHTLAKLRDEGVVSVKELDEVTEGSSVVIRAHGVTPEVMASATSRELEVIDGTCSWVTQEQKELAALGLGVVSGSAPLIMAEVGENAPQVVDAMAQDGVFVRKIAASGEDYAVVKSINEIGHFLGKKTIGEYVADEQILRCVSEIGVDFAQGYGIAPPMLLDDLLPYLAEQTVAQGGGDVAGRVTG